MFISCQGPNWPIFGEDIQILSYDITASIVVDGSYWQLSKDRLSNAFVGGNENEGSLEESRNIWRKD